MERPPFTPAVPARPDLTALAAQLANGESLPRAELAGLLAYTRGLERALAAPEALPEPGDPDVASAAETPPLVAVLAATRSALRIAVAALEEIAAPDRHAAGCGVGEGGRWVCAPACPTSLACRALGALRGVYGFR
jgi:hypothetical protein